MTLLKAMAGTKVHQAAGPKRLPTSAMAPKATRPTVAPATLATTSHPATEARTDVEHPVTRPDSKLVEQPRPELGMPVVQFARGIDGKQHVVIGRHRIVAGNVPVPLGKVVDLPGRRAQEALARDGCEGRDDAV